MVTSFMLAGNVPYLKRVPEDLPIDDMLRARLSNLPEGQNLYETDLLELAEGLEGRSQNPIPLLMDNLLRPCADLGIPADPLIEWKYDVEKQISHIVLGRGPPGGAWHTFPPGVRTLSPGAWLSLPPLAAAAPGRLRARAVADYCRRYVRVCRLQRYFRSGAVVTSVTRAPRVAAPRCVASCPLQAGFWVSGFDVCEGRAFRYLCRRVVVACGAGARPNSLPHATDALHALADIEQALTELGDCGGTHTALVVGSGASAADAVGAARARGVRALHVHRAPPAALARLDPQEYPDYCQVYKMMCDGSKGNYPNYKSFPDHVIIDVTPEVTDPACGHGLKRVRLLDLTTDHVTEVTVSLIAVLIGSKPDLFFLQTNFNLNCIQQDDCINCLQEKHVKKKMDDERKECFLKNHWMNFKNVLEQGINSCKSRYLNYSEINGNTDTKCELSDCNRRPEKTRCACDKTEEIIPDNCECQANPYSSGIGFGIDPKKPVDGRANPVAIDKSTHELLNGPKGVYALGPLTADNFVRFIPGGALALVAHIHKDKKSAE
ncbi:oxidative stress-induced growth inhibitor 1-like isoform X1 [Ostrinia furnacalis]|uniref:oxidative stress-induced growth inhibitor 1-like isoform X1 n=1 Tax=Ostrinia furnacalis TaxID=93504 RepID=UPI00103F45C7|nr:oxidative stress-induced growth inhibitor 1-like isoform X1 [Ostrinia furnacalis]